MSEKIDIFEVLQNIDDCNFDYYDNLTEEQKKTISLFVVARWLSCTRNTKQIVAVNSLVNTFLYKMISKHPKLLYKMMLISSSGTRKQYKWVPKKKKQSSKPETIKILSKFYDMSARQVEDYIDTFSLEDVISCANDLGADDSIIKKIKNEFK